MKMLNIAFLALSLSPLGHAAGPSNLTVRCEGINEKRVRVGFDMELDPVYRMISLTTFEAEATHVVDIASDLGAPRVFFHENRDGKMEVFGFTSFNDGFEPDMEALWVKGREDLTVLRLKNARGRSYLAKGDVGCRILK